MTKHVLNVGLIGLGRSGRDIHGQLLVQLPELYKIAAAADPLPERRERAEEEYGCRTYHDWQSMVDQEQLDLIVNASPSHQHVPITMALLEQGHHVLCEKPLARTVEEVDQLTQAAARSGSRLAVFQQARYQPAFRKLQEVIASGVLGEIVQIDLTISGFSRRWDWQTQQSHHGGSLMNTGPHPLDQALQLFGDDVEPDVWCRMERTLTLGDAEDDVKLILSGPGKPLIDIEISSCAAYSRPAYRVKGTQGGLQGDGSRLTWKHYNPEEAPEQQLVEAPLAKSDGTPAYCSEQLNWVEGSWDAPPPPSDTPFHEMTERLYTNLHESLTTGAATEVTVAQVRRQLQIMETCRSQNPHLYTK
ncbi:Gfo/Idh/MocA family protein [Paenibacillus daejeonensis]|uniref:Gfo/Idh/MocA family protein n=1 Tax=Paenibacillus daejeonensis TaxID=135193 RepID=UPI00036EF0B1|nr:Gfo/Idh/MocA family oxidoreductase [Paenibacillus daejeonensis]